MRPAAVGHQCPSCVAEGAKSTRSGRTAYGGRRSGAPALTSQVLIGINVLVWLAIQATGGRLSSLVDQVALIPSGQCSTGRGGVYPGLSEATCQIPGTHWVDGVATGAWWQLVTSVFAHVEIWHIGFNMLALWFLGPQLEAALGRLRFLALYLISGLVGSVAVLWLTPSYVPTLGASGAIFGLLGALLVVAVKVGGDVRGILTWIGINAVITVTGSSFISWQGHLGGFVGGVLIAALLVYSPRPRRTAWQATGLSAVLVLTLVLAAVRVSALA